MSRNTTALMTDIETMSTEPNAAIVSIGACAFDPLQNQSIEELDERFYTTISLQTCVDAGLHISAGTVEWWLKQSPDAQAALFAEPHRQLRTACTEFRMWADDLRPKITSCWANDPDFDYVILREAYKAVGVMWPFAFWMNRSCRTIKDLAWPNGDTPDFRAGTLHHRADDDAAAQALMVQAAHHILMNLS